MPAKPKSKPVILMGIHKGKQVTITKKKPKVNGNIIVNIVDGPTIEISKSMVL